VVIFKNNPRLFLPQAGRHTSNFVQIDRETAHEIWLEKKCKPIEKYNNCLNFECFFGKNGNIGLTNDQDVFSLADLSSISDSS